METAFSFQSESEIEIRCLFVHVYFLACDFGFLTNYLAQDLAFNVGKTVKERKKRHGREGEKESERRQTDRAR